MSPRGQHPNDVSIRARSLILTHTHTYTHVPIHTHTHTHTRIQKPKARTISIREIRSEKKNERKRGKKGKKGIDAWLTPWSPTARIQRGPRWCVRVHVLATIPSSSTIAFRARRVETALEVKRARKIRANALRNGTRAAGRPILFATPRAEKAFGDNRESSSRGASLPRLPGRTHGHPPDSAMIGPRAPSPHPSPGGCHRTAAYHPTRAPCATSAPRDEYWYRIIRRAPTFLFFFFSFFFLSFLFFLFLVGCYRQRRGKIGRRIPWNGWRYAVGSLVGGGSNWFGGGGEGRVMGWLLRVKGTNEARNVMDNIWFMGFLGGKIWTGGWENVSCASE